MQTSVHDQFRSLLMLRDEDGHLLVSREVVDMASQFLDNCMSDAGAMVELPAIVPGPNGSIDLYWKNPNYEMLLNVPADKNCVPNFYGDDRDGRTIKGNVELLDRREFVSWLKSASRLSPAR